MALICSVKPTNLTFDEFADKIREAVVRKSMKATRIDTVFEVFLPVSIKDDERSKRALGTATEFKQIVGNKKIQQWSSFLSNGNNKTVMAKFILSNLSRNWDNECKEKCEEKCEEKCFQIITIASRMSYH